MSASDPSIMDEAGNTRSDRLEVALSPSEKELYEFIRRRGEVMTSDLPPRMMGALPRLIRRGLVAVYKKRTMPWSGKKRKFVTAVA